ncbi:2'-5' RNA ligase family protein [Brachybacterium sacelli]|nr:2'-5' RNA ligase family protein [Brachybacterium sacelli]
MVGVAHTVIQVPVPELESITQRLERPPVCPHITLLGPFVDRRDVNEDLVDTLRALLAQVRPFDFMLSAVGRFGSEVTYLAPEPADPFIRLTNMLAAAFPKWPPYGGAFEEIIPHLSIGAALTSAEEEAVRGPLPISSTADEVTLTWWSEDAAEELARFPLHL